ncbi:helix-turn-helix domain-containing protein [Fuchsiella alkaliacetigena]|uniref:helix-turn-helix domain-containing protein n=1 Tax=Fuchsiella alkaliacetigena TaxID=957042 RepID=UPI00200B8B98|nr:DDE-type integrase/transposase/recombinase [Fuchsiella alkaliacetigena]MCK8824812.1 DDE-type integrase/transposase/recombinase [Fuchsiella alkaliacetigena]
MTDNDREQIALFRFRLISPILNGQVENQSEYLATVSAKKYDVPYYGLKEYAPKTVYTWLRNYRRNGFDALKPKKRSDRGASRKITPELEEMLLSEREKFPQLSVSLFYDQLVAKDKLLPSQLSYSTVYRFFKREGLLTNSPRRELNRRRFAYDCVNALWQGDTMVGPYLKVDSKKIKTFLFAFIDDCSRVIPFAMFLVSEKFSSVAKVLSEAILRRGIPRLIYVDNGKVYRSDRLHFACAALGVTLIHTKPYDAASKGKIERFFLTVRKRFIPLLTDDDLSSLDALNQKFFRWLEEDYHRKFHSALEMTPLDKYMSQISKVKTFDDPEKMKMIFLKRAKRKVKHDATISVNCQLYEVPPTLIAKRIEVRFNPDTYEKIFIYDDGKCLGLAKPVVLSDNAYVKRKDSISFQDIIKERD